MNAFLWLLLSCSSQEQDSGVVSTEMPPPLEDVNPDSVQNADDLSNPDDLSDSEIPELPPDPTQIVEEKPIEPEIPQIDLLMKDDAEIRITAEEIDKVIEKASDVGADDEDGK